MAKRKRPKIDLKKVLAVAMEEQIMLGATDESYLGAVLSNLHDVLDTVASNCALPAQGHWGWESDDD